MGSCSATDLLLVPEGLGTGLSLLHRPAINRTDSLPGASIEELLNCAIPRLNAALWQHVQGKPWSVIGREWPVLLRRAYPILKRRKAEKDHCARLRVPLRGARPIASLANKPGESRGWKLIPFRNYKSQARYWLQAGPARR
ncbi:hypothetical protein SKAU_G00262580 [Synaphobranchus kaupii]|uniref:Uncharacterized protein n=1 Tax=Synaphobranchus kaupii TaxID=118154 RepID=A0A9Q1IPU4_SYNKA|nr:hypothetical protein SKAU_G00262580 [Synaphobranchus kaupii]